MRLGLLRKGCTRNRYAFSRLNLDEPWKVNKLNVSARVVDALMPENAYTYEEMETHILAYDSEADDQSSQVERKTRRMVVITYFSLPLNSLRIS